MVSSNPAAFPYHPTTVELNEEVQGILTRNVSLLLGTSWIRSVICAGNIQLPYDVCVCVCNESPFLLLLLLMLLIVNLKFVCSIGFASCLDDNVILPLDTVRCPLGRPFSFAIQSFTYLYTRHVLCRNLWIGKAWKSASRSDILRGMFRNVVSSSLSNDNKLVWELLMTMINLSIPFDPWAAVFSNPTRLRRPRPRTMLSKRRLPTRPV